jgi:hypothetical protein
MALITHITHQPLQSVAKHMTVDCTYTIVHVDGQKQLQLDTYGSSSRAILGKKSQSIRLTPEALASLKKIIQENGL